MEPSTSNVASLSTAPTASLPSGSASTSSPAELSDVELLTATRRLVGRSNQLLASLLAHLAEVEARGIHRTRACASLYTYCIYELRFSEDEAFRRISAARLVRRFPELLEAIAAGELHLTGLLMLGPLLTPDNLGEVLARAKHRTKKEIASLVRQLDPLPRVPPRIEPLGPAPSPLAPQAPTWNRFMGALNPVRELQPGDRPSDWMESAASAWTEPTGSTPPANDDDTTAELSDSAATAPQPASPTPARLEPQRYRVQFEASEEYVHLVERAKALLSHAAPRADLGELHLRAMRCLVAELERQKYAVTARPRPPAAGGSERNASAKLESRQEPEPSARADSPQEREPSRTSTSEPPRQRGRHVPAAIRRAVFARDARRCTHTSDTGQRCRETAWLELHHTKAFARRGEHRLENLTLRCRAHNALAAEDDFGKDVIARARDSRPHEPWAVQEGTPFGSE
jgi:5-methylcytosine-specific restriction endonuclease McrA